MDGEKVSYEFQRKWRSGGRKWSEFQDKGNCDVPLIISNPIKNYSCILTIYTSKVHITFGVKISIHPWINQIYLFHNLIR